MTARVYRLYCPKCQREATDEQCPHWDFEEDPRYRVGAGKQRGLSEFYGSDDREQP